MSEADPTDGFGDCIVTRHWRNGLAELTVDQADPRVLWTRELLEAVADGSALGSPEVSLRGDVLTINAANQRVIYRIGEYLPDRQAYVAEWPD